MRIYGSSPLYTYVELIFRCKRLFIIALILGTLIVSTTVYMRPDSYTATRLISLVGSNPDLYRQYTGASEDTQHDKVLAAARNKFNWFQSWVESPTDFPELIPFVVDSLKLRERYKDKTKIELITDISKHITLTPMTSVTVIELKFTWPNERESTEILDAIYDRFKNRIVNQENSTLISLEGILAEQFKKADIDANQKAVYRVQYQAKHFNAIPTMLSAQIGRVDQAQAQLQDAQLDLGDAEQKLRDINAQIRTIPKEIVDSQTTQDTLSDPTVSLQAEYDDLDKQYKQITTVYSPQHPKVLDLQKRMAVLKQQIDEKKQEIKRKPQTPNSTVRETKRAANPEYRDLMQQKRELERTSNALNRRVRTLSDQLTKSRSAIQVMPNTEVEWHRIDTDYHLADQIRQSTKSQLESTRFELDKNIKVSGREVSSEVPAHAQKTETAGKKYTLYALGPLLGIVVAFCFSLLLETMDHTLRTPVEVEKYLNKPVLAVIPKMAVARDSRKQLGGSSKTSISS